jgi:hypothetical protein
VCLVELEVGSHVDEQRAVRTPLLDLSRGERHHLDPGRLERSAIEVDDRLEVGRLGRELRGRTLDEPLLVHLREQLVVPQLVTDRRGDLEVHPGSAAERAAEVARPDLGLGRQREEPLVEAVEDPPGTLFPVDREVRSRDVADEQAVARQHRPRLLAA